MVLEVEGTTEKLRQEISSIENKAKKDYRENKRVTKKILIRIGREREREYLATKSKRFFEN